MFEYKPLEKSAKKEKDFSGQGSLRQKLRRFDFIVLPMEIVYEAIMPIPVIGPIIKFIVKVFAITGAFGLIALILITLVGAGAIFAVWISDVAGPSDF